MSIVINAMMRTNYGKGASRRLCRQERLPAIVYGGDETPCAISLNVHEITHLLNNEETYTSVLDLLIDKKKEIVIIKDLQRHRVKNRITHIDFQRIDLKKTIITRVPLHFNGSDDNAAIRTGAILNQFLTTVEIACLPTNLPHSIEVDVSKLEVGEHISLTDLIIPESVSIVALQHGDIEAHNQAVVSVVIPKKVVEEVEEVKEEEDETEGEDTEQSDEQSSDDSET